MGRGHKGQVPKSYLFVKNREFAALQQNRSGYGPPPAARTVPAGFVKTILSIGAQAPIV